ncbi:hypothetical protein [Agromyces subbeticus]|uniref:hypothetical protein n=1 Tax=Agromyces subbeticus TaxID=293890 RepID=UPI0003B34072|nr:hypothetical protein [Agromyces subbeticus]
MTLTRLLPTLRRSIPDPIDPDLWPAATDPSITDVEVGGVSLLRLAELCGTPAVHLGRAVVPGTGAGSGTRPATAVTGSTGVAVVCVLEASVDQGGRTVTIDADLEPLDPAWAEARLIGRVSVARTTPTTIRAGASVRAAASVGSAASGCLAPRPVDLPADLMAGDLLALPYAAVTDEAGVARPASGWPTTLPESTQQIRTL